MVIEKPDQEEPNPGHRWIRLSEEDLRSLHRLRDGYASM